MSAFLVSILIGTQGRPEWAVTAKRRAVPSAEQQPAYEVIHRHGHYNERLHVTRNRLAEEASGEWLCFLDGDDELAPGYLDAMRGAWDDYRGEDHGVLSQPPPALLVPAIQYVAPTGRWRGMAAIPAWDADIYDTNCACIGTLVQAESFRRVGGFEAWPIYEDWELWLRLLVVEDAVLVPVPRAVYMAYESRGGRNQNAGVAEGVWRRVRQRYERERVWLNERKLG